MPTGPRNLVASSNGVLAIVVRTACRAPTSVAVLQWAVGDGNERDQVASAAL
jgi:hypothetical protein